MTTHIEDSSFLLKLVIKLEKYFCWWTFVALIPTPFENNTVKSVTYWDALIFMIIILIFIT